MFLPLKVAVESVGENVALSIGNWRREIFFEHAVLLASWMDECAREAKEWAGVKRRSLRGVGTLHDASDPHWLTADEPFTPAGVLAREMLKKEQIGVRQLGATVVIKLGAHEATMPFAASFMISQWIRVQAKNSKTRAGDTTRHWSEIRRDHEAQQGPGVTRG